MYKTVRITLQSIVVIIIFISITGMKIVDDKDIETVDKTVNNDISRLNSPQENTQNIVNIPSSKFVLLKDNIIKVIQRNLNDNATSPLQFIGPVPSIVFDPTNLQQALIMVENLKDQVTQTTTMVKQLSKGHISPELISVLYSNLTDCGWHALEFPYIADDIPQIDLNHLCTNASTLFKQGQINLLKNFFTNPEKDTDPKLRADKLMLRMKTLIKTKASAKIIADLGLAQQKTEQQTLEAVKNVGDANSILDALNINNQLMRLQIQQQIKTNVTLDYMLKIRTESE